MRCSDESCRSGFVVTPEGLDVTRHTELMPEIAQEPNYDAALAALK